MGFTVLWKGFDSRDVIIRLKSVLLPRDNCQLF